MDKPVDKRALAAVFMSLGVTFRLAQAKSWADFCNDAECTMSIADTYRSMSEDVRRLAHETKDEAARDAYLALAKLWHERSVRLESGVVPTKQAHYG